MNIAKIWFVILIAGITTVSTAQNKIKKFDKFVPFPVCHASGKVEKSFTPPPPEFLLKSASEKKCEIIVNYSLFPQKAKDAFEYAVSIWESILESDVPIYIQANWRSLDKNTLGSAGPSSYYTDFKYIPHEHRYYPVAIAEKLSGTEITGPGSPDITATFNKEINWYYGTDGDTPSELYDFVSVVLHEITHGLGFTGFFYIKDLQGAYAYNNIGEAAAFDLLVEKDSVKLVDTTVYKIPSFSLGRAFKSNKLYAGSIAAIAGNNNKKPKLYAPSEFDEGSSIYHLNDATYPSGNINSLMTHAVGKGEAIHNPGPITRGILADIGWEHIFMDFEKVKDIETVKPLTFNLKVTSDIKLDTASLYVFYSYDNFSNHKDSLLLAKTETANIYSARFTPTINSGTINYYLIAKDTLNRVFTLPTEAPAILYSVVIGPDTIAPELDHKEIAFFILANDSLSITTFADDNLGVDTVFVNYEIDGEVQQPFGLHLDSLHNYSGYFNFDYGRLSDGAIITYTITATDSSAAGNSTTIPASGEYSFKVEKILGPVGGYTNNFNVPSTDFILTDFEIYTDTLFNDGALHSPHPYPSPDRNNAFYNFTTILKHPIILFEGGKLTFDEIVLVEPGEPQAVYGDDDFWDYVIVEGSKDYGKSWLPLADGYDSGDNKTWEINYLKNVEGNNSKTIGVPWWYYNREIDLLGNDTFNVNDTILLRFRLFSDPYAHGWGWAIDNIRIQSPVSAESNYLNDNILIYPNPAGDFVTVSVNQVKATDKISIDMFNLYGQKISSVSNKNTTGEVLQRIDLRALSGGIYFIVIRKNGNTVYSKKLIKSNN